MGQSRAGFSVFARYCLIVQDRMKWETWPVEIIGLGISEEGNWTRERF
jgi:hypothetical protein